MDINTIMQTVSDYSLLLIPLTLGITQILKKFLPDAFLEKGTPLISLIVGIVSAAIMIGLNGQAFITGAVIGLSASGLWSATVTPFKKTDSTTGTGGTGG
jgi:hypothetical protein